MRCKPLKSKLRISDIEAYVDADWVSQAHHHSMPDYIVMLSRGPIAWSACKQPIIVLSTAEAECIALATIGCKVLYLQLLLTELYKPVELPTPILCDNQAPIAMASNNKFNSHTKHIDLRYHFIRGHIKNSTFALTYCPTNDNIVDTFTKPLPCPCLQKLHLMSLDTAWGGVLDREEMGDRSESWGQNRMQGTSAIKDSLG